MSDFTFMLFVLVMVIFAVTANLTGNMVFGYVGIGVLALAGVIDAIIGEKQGN